MPVTPLKRVILADDSHRSRQVLRRLLEEIGCQVIAEAEDGDEVLRLYQKHHPQVVLMDVIMPTMGGMTALARLRQRDPHAQVILLCSSHSWETALAARTMGARFFLYKPCEAKTLKRVLTQI